MTDNKLIDDLANNNIPIYNVSEITEEITSFLESKYGYVKIKGEVSGSSGDKYPHIYFTLKDKSNVINAKIWKTKIPYLKIFPKDGLEIICTGKISAWTKNNSEFYLDVDSISLEGVGQLLKMKEELRKKLEQEGVFDLKYKKKLPTIPSSIGFITSPSGSVIKDMQKIIFERFPTSIKLYPSSVQGDKAVKDVTEGIRHFNNCSKEDKVDVIIIARGGGSVEDLWCFNDEKIVREVFKSNIPIISAIGHAPDVNLIDYVADKEAATPSHAAKLVVPEREKLLMMVENSLKSLKKSVQLFWDKKKQFLNLNFNKVPKTNSTFLFKKKEFIKIKNKFTNVDLRFFKNLDMQLDNIVSKFNIGSHLNTLKRGYVYIKDLKKNSFITKSKNIKPNTNISINFFDGKINAITKKNH